MKRPGWILRAVCAGALACWVSLGSGQEFPTKPVRIIVLYAPGGTPDVVSRFIAPSLGNSLGQPVTVENRSGAGVCRGCRKRFARRLTAIPW